MVDKFQRIYISTVEGAFEAMLRDALSQVADDGLIKLVVFCNACDGGEYKQHDHLVHLSVNAVILLLFLNLFCHGCFPFCLSFSLSYSARNSCKSARISSGRSGKIIGRVRLGKMA